MDINPIQPTQIRKHIKISDLSDKNFFETIIQDFVVLPSFDISDDEDEIIEENICKSKMLPQDANTDLSGMPMDKVYISTWNIFPNEYKLLFDDKFFLYATWLDVLPEPIFEKFIDLFHNKTLDLSYILENEEYKKLINTYNLNGKSIEKILTENYTDSINDIIQQQMPPKQLYASVSDMFNVIDMNINKLNQLTIITDDNIIFAAYNEEDLNKLKESVFLYGEYKTRDMTYLSNKKPVYISTLELKK